MPRVREETAMEPSQQGSLAAISNFYITESISDELDCKKAIVRESEGAKGRRGEGGGVIIPWESCCLATNIARTYTLDAHDGGFGKTSILCRARCVFLPVTEMGKAARAWMPVQA